MLMAGANFGRFLAYWLYCFELLKVAELMPQVVNKDFKSQKDPLVSIQKKKSEQSLQGFNILMIVVLSCVVLIHLASESLVGVLLTYIPQIIQIGTLGYAFTHIRACMNTLSEVTGSTIAVNEKRMYL